MSTIKTNTLQNVAGTLTIPVDTVVQGSAKAWVNFNGTGTVSIRAAFNVSSITDNGTGNYTLNFTTSMVDASYSAVFGGMDTDTTASFNVQVGIPLNGATASSLNVVTGVSQNTTDIPTVNVTIFR